MRNAEWPGIARYRRRFTDVIFVYTAILTTPGSSLICCRRWKARANELRDSSLRRKKRYSVPKA